MDNIRAVYVSNMILPVGIPLTYEGVEVGKVVSNDITGSKCALNDDNVARLLKSNDVSFSLEVIRK